MAAEDLVRQCAEALVGRLKVGRSSADNDYRITFGSRSVRVPVIDALGYREQCKALYEAVEQVLGLRPMPDEPAPDPASQVCKRCGDMDRAKFEALDNPRKYAEDGDTHCPKCIGLSWAGVIDCIYDLGSVPTDALMRALARRFL